MAVVPLYALYRFTWSTRGIRQCSPPLSLSLFAFSSSFAQGPLRGHPRCPLIARDTIRYISKNRFSPIRKKKSIQFVPTESWAIGRILDDILQIAQLTFEPVVRTHGGVGGDLRPSPPARIVIDLFARLPGLGIRWRALAREAVPPHNTCKVCRSRERVSLLSICMHKWLARDAPISRSLLEFFTYHLCHHHHSLRD